VIENIPYLADPEGVQLLPGVCDAIATFRLAGFAIVIVTNQSGIARGLCSADQYRAVEVRLIEQLGPNNIDLIYMCPFHPDGRGPFGCEHPWRKPGAGMLLDAGERFGLDLARSWMVGDSLSDIQAGARAGVGHLVHVATGHGQAERAAVEAFAAHLGHDRDTTAPIVRCVPGIDQLTELWKHL